MKYLFSLLSIKKIRCSVCSYCFVGVLGDINSLMDTLEQFSCLLPASGLLFFIKLPTLQRANSYFKFTQTSLLGWLFPHPLSPRVIAPPGPSSASAQHGLLATAPLVTMTPFLTSPLPAHEHLGHGIFLNRNSGCHFCGGSGCFVCLFLCNNKNTACLEKRNVHNSVPCSLPHHQHCVLDIYLLQNFPFSVFNNMLLVLFFQPSPAQVFSWPLWQVWGCNTIAQELSREPL